MGLGRDEYFCVGLLSVDVARDGSIHLHLFLGVTQH
jgi:hypothetical protein